MPSPPLSRPEPQAHRPVQIRTADIYDSHGPQLELVEPLLRDFGGRENFFGPIRTLSLFEDNSLVRSTLEQPGAGAVLVVDGGGSLRCALLGDQLGALAARNQWAGLVINGCVRDSQELAQLPLGIKALATHPAKSEKRGVGRSGESVRFAGATFRPGHYLYADSDGVLLSAQALEL